MFSLQPSASKEQATIQRRLTPTGSADRAGQPEDLVQTRLVSLDAYRGFIMLAMASAGLGLTPIANHFAGRSGGNLLRTMARHAEHVEWTGWVFWDFIQPAFMFMVGVSLAFSAAARRQRGQSYASMTWHALIRSLVLIVLGVFLISNGQPITNFSLVNVLTQIGLGYFFLFLLWGRPAVVQWGAAIVILVGYWLAFFLYPLPPEGFDTTAVGVPADWPHLLSGTAAHWNKNMNAAAAFDVKLLNLFPRDQPFVFNNGGYQTLNFIPSLATMIFGLIAGEFLRGAARPGRKLLVMLIAGAVGVAIGWSLDYFGVCPLVKRIWTPSWAIFSAGGSLLMLAVFYLLTDFVNLRLWAWPLTVVGMNSIVMYCMSMVMAGWLQASLKTHAGYPRAMQFWQRLTPDRLEERWGMDFSQELFDVLGSHYHDFLIRALPLALMWLICVWLYRQRIFVRI